MSKKKTERQKIHRIIVGALRETIRVHGEISSKLIGSAAKRITGSLFARRKKNESLSRNAKT